MDEARLLELDAELRRMFGDLPRPRCTRSVAQSLDDDWVVTDESWKALAAEDPEQHWWEVPDGVVPELASIFIWLPPDAFCFYYAALLSFTIRSWNFGGGTRPTGFGAIHQNPKNLDQFSAEQLKFVAETLTELSCDPRGAKFHIELHSTLAAIEQREWKLAQMAGVQ